MVELLLFIAVFLTALLSAIFGMAGCAGPVIAGLIGHGDPRGDAIGIQWLARYPATILYPLEDYGTLHHRVCDGRGWLDGSLVELAQSLAVYSAGSCAHDCLDPDIGLQTGSAPADLWYRYG